jgi:hypothetical protein
MWVVELLQGIRGYWPEDPYTAFRSTGESIFRGKESI